MGADICGGGDDGGGEGHREEVDVGDLGEEEEGPVCFGFVRVFFLTRGIE